MAWTKEQMCEITADLEIKDGLCINLGIGMPTNVPNYIKDDIKVIFQSENGMLGIGPFPTKDEVDPDLINAGKQTITQTPYTSYFDSATSFGMIRGGHLDLAILGALQVSEYGDLANWTVPGKMVKGMGGAMDLVANIKRIVIIMDHVAKDGSSKILKKCSLPLTGVKVVDRIITDLGVFDIDEEGLSIIRKADDVSIEDIKLKTNADFRIKIL
jgi:3-oxoacid CoA-transferase subunit B